MYLRVLARLMALASLLVALGPSGASQEVTVRLDGPAVEWSWPYEGIPCDQYKVYMTHDPQGWDMATLWTGCPIYDPARDRCTWSRFTWSQGGIYNGPDNLTLLSFQYAGEADRPYPPHSIGWTCDPNDGSPWP